MKITRLILAVFISLGLMFALTPRAEAVVADNLAVTYNNPRGTKAQQYVQMDKMIQMIRKIKADAKGCKQRKVCPTLRAGAYSIASDIFTDEVIWAWREGVNVQIVMRKNIADGKNPDGTPDLKARNYHRLAEKFGEDPKKASFIIRCAGSCRGAGGSDLSMHSKFWLYSDAQGRPYQWSLGSYNPNEPSSIEQYNDLVTGNDPCVYNELVAIFNEMRLQQHKSRVPVSCGSKYYMMAFPQAATGRNILLEGLDAIKCDRTTVTASGKTTVLVHLSEALKDIGERVATKLAWLKSKGCVVEVILNHASSPEVVNILTKGHVTFTRSSGKIYDHLKGFTVGGGFGKNANDRVVFTGSSNFSPGYYKRDDVVLRIRGDVDLYNKYVAHHRATFNAVKSHQTARGMGTMATPRGED